MSLDKNIEVSSGGIQKFISDLKNSALLQDTHLVMNALIVGRDDNGEEHRIHANAIILGQNMHVTLLRIKDEDGLQGAFCDEDSDELDLLAAYASPDGGFATIEVPGFKGEWVLAIFPYSK